MAAPTRRLPVCALAAACAGLVLATSISASAAVGAHRLLSSRMLWATVDVCNAPDQPDYIGIRGSMPGDGRARDRMYMSFRIQYLDASTSRWIDLEHGVSSAYALVGGGGSPRQGGSSFQLMPAAGVAFSLRGVVRFQWRRGSRVIVAATRITTAGHQSAADADPPGFSAATCVIG